VVVSPGSAVDPVWAAGSDLPTPGAVHISGLFPLRSLSLRLDSGPEALRLEERVNEVSLSVVNWMCGQFLLERGADGVHAPTLEPVRGTERERPGPLVCGAYVLSMSLPNHLDRLMEKIPITARDMEVGCAWLEIRGPMLDDLCGDEVVQLTYYSDHRPGARVLRTRIVSLADSQGWSPEVANHVLFVSRRPERPAHYAYEVPRVEVIVCRSATEAAALCDLALAALRGGGDGSAVAQAPLAAQPLPQTAGVAATMPGPQCWALDIRP